MAPQTHSLRNQIPPQSISPGTSLVKRKPLTTLQPDHSAGASRLSHVSSVTSYRPLSNKNIVKDEDDPRDMTHGAQGRPVEHRGADAFWLVFGDVISIMARLLALSYVMLLWYIDGRAVASVSFDVHGFADVTRVVSISSIGYMMLN